MTAAKQSEAPRGAIVPRRRHKQAGGSFNVHRTRNRKFQRFQRQRLNGRHFVRTKDDDLVGAAVNQGERTKHNRVEEDERVGDKRHRKSAYTQCERDLSGHRTRKRVCETERVHDTPTVLSSYSFITMGDSSRRCCRECSDTD
jgi:hypothetical protein